MNYKKKLKREMQKEYSQNGYSFRSETFLIDETLVKELILKSFGAEFIMIIEDFEDEYEYEAIRLKLTGLKTVPHKFHKSVKYSSRSEKAGQPKEIQDNLFILKERYKDVTKLEDIEHCDKHIELTLISETEPNLRIIFKVNPENTDPVFFYDLSIRFYREFFEYTDTVNNNDEKYD